MDDRITAVAFVAAASGVIAAAGFAASGSLELFAPCRVLYRTHQAVQDSLACQAYSAITLFSSLLLLAAGGFAAAAVVLLLWRRRAARSGLR